MPDDINMEPQNDDWTFWYQKNPIETIAWYNFRNKENSDTSTNAAYKKKKDVIAISNMIHPDLTIVVTANENDYQAEKQTNNLWR